MKSRLYSPFACFPLRLRQTETETETETETDLGGGTTTKADCHEVESLQQEAPCVVRYVCLIACMTHNEAGSSTDCGFHMQS